MLEHGHNHYFVLASLAIALMSGFTGLSLTRGASQMGAARRKLVVSMSAIALGSGIWSMHFVAMLGMTLPVPFYYDALITMISALVAILVTGIALLLVHFGERTTQRIVLAGICAAVGALAMHYIGMSGIQEVKPVYSISGILIAVISAFVLFVASFLISYGNRQSRNILFGTLVFGVAVVSMHFIAMAGTHFYPIEDVVHSGLWMSNEVLAFGVTVSSFVISGAFLLMGVTFAAQFAATDTGAESLSPLEQPEEPIQPEHSATTRLPYEMNGRTHFIADNQVSAIQAEGHYTFLYQDAERLFCPLSLSEVERRIPNPDFVKCHRSYLVNTAHVSSFERKKDNGVCYLQEGSALEAVPVSRSYLKQVREALGL